MARKTSPRADVQEALALMQEGRMRGQGRRSPVLLWMLKNREALERGFQEHYVIEMRQRADGTDVASMT